jgi:hypothetical protein
VTEEKFRLILEASKAEDFDLATLQEYIDTANKVASGWGKDSAKKTDHDKLLKSIGHAESVRTTLEESRLVASTTTNQNRVAELGFAMDQKFVGGRDLMVFSDRVDSLFDWHLDDDKKTLILRHIFLSCNPVEWGKPESWWNIDVLT